MTTLSTRTIVFGATNPKGQYDPVQRIPHVVNLEVKFINFYIFAVVFFFFVFCLNFGTEEC